MTIIFPTFSFPSIHTLIKKERSHKYIMEKTWWCQSALLDKHQCRDIPSFLIIFFTPLLRGGVWLRMVGAMYHKPVLRGQLVYAWSSPVLPMLTSSCHKNLSHPPVLHTSYTRYNTNTTLGFSSRSRLTSWPSNELWPPGSYYPLWKFKFSKLATFSFGETHLSATISENFPCNMENLHLSSFGADKR